MELKLDKRNRCLELDKTFNQTKMELKLKVFILQGFNKSSFNQTKMELKPNQTRGI